MVPIPCNIESLQAHLSENKSELSDSSICEIECFLIEDMRDTPSEMRVVVDRSSETILHSNNLPSTSSVFSYDVLGALADDAPSLKMMHIMEDEEVVHMEATTTSTPTSHERHKKGNMGVNDAMIPLVDMMNCVDDENDLLHGMDDFCDITYDSFSFPCDALPLHIVDHVELLDCDGLAVRMPCYESFTYPTIALDMPSHDGSSISPIVACNMLNNCSFTCFACNDSYTVSFEIAPIAF